MSTAAFAPTVTILLCVYNCAHWVGEAIESCLAQERIDFELLIVDDGSTDGTPAVLGRYAKDNPGVIRIVTIAHSGLAAARNRGFDEARGEFISIVDADDMMMPLRCHLEAEGLRRYPNAIICISKRWNFIDGTDRGVYGFLGERIFGHEVHDHVEFEDPVRVLIEGGEYPGTSACTVRTSFARVEGRYNEALSSFEDGDLWVRKVHRHSVVYCPAPLYLRRLHTGSMSQPAAHGLAQIYGATEKTRRIFDEYSPRMRKAVMSFEQRVGIDVVRTLIDSGQKGAAMFVMFRYFAKLFGKQWVRMLVRVVVPAAVLERRRSRRGDTDLTATEGTITLDEVRQCSEYRAFESA